MNSKYTYDPFRDGVTQGLLTTFMRCREETTNQIEGLEPLKEGAGLQFGSLTHRVLEIVYGIHKKPPPKEYVLETLRRVESEFRKEEGSRFSPEGMENLETNMAMLQAVLPLYFKHHHKDFETQKWVELEQMFRVESPYPKIDLVGRIDGAFDLRKEFWLFESKTKSRIEEDILSDSLSFDFQTNVYQYALLKKYNRKPNGVLYNIVRRPSQRLKKEEKLSDFSSRIGEEIVKEPEHFFIRFEMATPKTEMDRFTRELFTVIKEFVAWWRGEIATYRNTSACLQRFGPCRFLPKCANGDVGLYRRRTVMFPELQD